MKKELLTLTMAIGLAVSMSMTAFAGWEQGTGENAGKWKYQFDDGSYAKGYIANGGVVNPYRCYWLEDRDGSGQKSLYYFDVDEWLCMETQIYDNFFLRNTVEINANGQALKDGEIMREDNGSSESTDSRVTETDGWIFQNDNIYYRHADGSYEKNGWVWLDNGMTNIAECYYFDKEGRLLKDTTTPDGHKVNSGGAWYSGKISTSPEQKDVQTVSEDNSVLLQEGYTRGLSNTAFYILNHSMEENNAKYEIEKSLYRQTILDDGRKRTSYYVKYKGIPLSVRYSARDDDKNYYTVDGIYDTSMQRNAILCDMPSHDYNSIRNKFMGTYYDWVGIGGAIISYRYENPEAYVYISFDTDNIKVEVYMRNG